MASSRAVGSRRLALVVGVLVVALSTACTHGESTKSSSMALATSGQIQPAASGGAAAGAPAAASASAGAAGGFAANAQPPAAHAAAAQPVAAEALQSRDIIRTATLQIEVGDVDKAANSLSRTAQTLGGRVDQDDRSSAGSRSAQLVLRLPPGQLDGAMSAADRLGRETDRTVKGQDVTASAADINARVAALHTSVERLQALLGSSANLPDLISLEAQLTQRQANLDSIVAQQRALSEQISLASLTVTLSSRAPVLVTRHEHSHLAGYATAFTGGVRAVTVGVRIALAGLGYGTPFLALAAVVLVPLFWLRRRRRHPVHPQPQA